MNSTYDIGDTVYLRESAALGFLEAYIIKSLRVIPDGNVLYKLIVSLKQPVSGQTMGDRVVGVQEIPLEMYESDLVSYCDALELCEINLASQLANIQSLRSNSDCDEDETA